MSRVLLAAVATTVAALASAFVVPSASAATAPEALLFLGVTYSDADPAGPRTVHGFLTCAPEGGLHRDPVAACAELAAAGGNVGATDVENPGVACPMIYAPVTVRAFGWYAGAPISHTTTYGNSCVFAASTGPVWHI
ncbi:SSI family serine proteinase inhibitor [Saccharothrix hoggarensis]|uniref:SSI family serine proteinase inhibitor n=1 Tax=Saccharothrix hoggarensis TaxID=913853 RepID=A0ABW3QQU8_9PSEU